MAPGNTLYLGYRDGGHIALVGCMRLGRPDQPEGWDHGSTEGEIFDAIKNGVAPDFNMVPWRDQLKDPDIWNVVNYLGSIAKKK